MSNAHRFIGSAAVSHPANDRTIAELKEEVKTLRSELEKERAERAKIVEWIRTNLGPNMQLVKAMVKEEVEQALRTSKPAIAETPKKFDLFASDSKPASDRASSSTFEDEKKDAPAFSYTNPTPAARPKDSSDGLKSSGSVKAEPSRKSATLPRDMGRPTNVESKPEPVVSKALANNAQSGTLSKSSSSLSLKDSAEGSRQFIPTSIPSEDTYYSDEEWSDSDEEAERELSKAARKKVKNERLLKIETALIPEAVSKVFFKDKDASQMGTMAKNNIEPTARYMQQIYGISVEGIYPTLLEFTAKGGKLLFVPPDREQYPFTLAIFQDDILYPVDHNGLSQSQILYLVLKGVKRSLGTEAGVELPHGTELSYDPGENSEFQNFELKTDREVMNRCFAAAFGQKKAKRFGEEEGRGFHPELTARRNEWKKNPKNQQTMKDLFDLFYWKQPQKKGNQSRIFFFVFQRTLLAVIRRLMNCNVGKLENLTVVAMPFDDSPMIPNEAAMKQMKLSKEEFICHQHIQAYKTYASLFKGQKEF
eukprot:TRINITY_DN1726_c0_g1_i1.p1 TRINITY_DN1726_c0_g1~~TRINITY_DN1726_c0_g1_i1.p1  ORF type:complete len:535 (-),score=138.85 TRINITY_DN1726_c0_g1_i1:50-1654(-)